MVSAAKQTVAVSRDHHLIRTRYSTGCYRGTPADSVALESVREAEYVFEDVVVAEARRLTQG